MGPVGPGLRAPGGPRTTMVTCIFYCSIINKTVQIAMVGLNIESIVSFPHNTFQSGERCYRGGNIGSRVIDSLFFPIACTDSSSHSFSKRATISGIAKGGRGHAPILQTICCHHMCSFKLKMQQNRFRLELRPGHRWRKL